MEKKLIRVDQSEPSLPNGQIKNLFLELELAYFKLLELNLITQSILDLLYDIVTKF